MTAPDTTAKAREAAGGGVAGPQRRSLQATLLSLAMTGLMVLELLHLFSRWELAGQLAIALVLALPVIGLTRLRAREAYLYALALVLTLVALADGRPEVQVFATALERSAFLASFILLMGLLREAAITSPTVGICGTYLTRQPSRRRFVAVFAGSHLFAVLINLGALSLLAPIVQRGVRQGRSLDTPLDEIGAVRERRQLSAVLRGFSWMLVWAPTAVTQAVLPVLIPNVEALRLIGLGLLLALVMLLVSWADDTLRWLPFRRRLAARGALPAVEPSAFPGAHFLRLALIGAALFGFSLCFTLLGRVSIVAGIMLAALLVVAGWIVLQQGGADIGQRLRASGGRLRAIGRDSLPGGVRETCTLAAAGYIGTLAAKLVPLEALPLDGGSLPTWLLLGLLSVLVWAGGQIGLSPITMAVFLGTLVAAAPTPWADPTWMALAIAAGTAICTTGSPFASGTLMLARASGHGGATLAWRWNAAYTALAAAALLAFYFVLTGGG